MNQKVQVLEKLSKWILLRMIFLKHSLTYSQAELQKILTRESFTDIIVNAISQGDEYQKPKPIHWAYCRCCQEEYVDGDKYIIQ